MRSMCNQPRLALLAGAVALALSACGGGGNVRSTPTPPTTPPPTGIGFTPNIANDGALTQVNPPTVSATPAPREFDPAAGLQMSLINAGGSVAAGAHGAGVGIGILDSGVRRDHPQLSPRVLYNGFYLNSPPNNQSVDYVLEHGTAVALTAAGSAIGRWPGGPAPGANIISGRFLSDRPPEDDGSGQGNELTTADARDFARFMNQVHADLHSRGARIINNSWGGVYFRDDASGAAAMAEGYRDFIINRGGLIVFSNGNYGRDDRYRADPSDTSSLPTLAPSYGLERGWLTVAALDPNTPTQLLDFSQQCGRAMNYCLAAPGLVWVLGVSPPGSVDPRTDQDYMYTVRGTSFSAPLVSGAAAVVWSAFPWMSNDQVRQTILGTAKDLGDPGVDAVFGWGLLDVTRASWGPGNFAWGDFHANVTSGHSVFRNAITGAGGLVKQGAGTLTLTEHATYAGTTRVDAGALDVRRGVASNVLVGPSGRLWGSGTFGGNIDNNGLFMAGAGSPASIAGNYTQGGTGNLGVWLGSTLNVTGTASLAGTLSILGVKSGYTTTAKETLLTAGSVTGTFAQTRAAPNVFLDATVSYDPNNVFLNINRIDVSKAVAGMGFGVPTTSGAQRMEAAMSAIDAQLATGGGAIDRRFIDGAGAFQRIDSMDRADASLRSLSGQVHAANAALTQGALEAGRRAVSSRLSDLAAMPRLSGPWVRDLAEQGDLAQAGFDSLSLGSSGTLLGMDTRIGEALVLGVAFSRLQQDGQLGAFGDSSRGLQQHTQWYAGWQRGGWQALAQFGFGGFDRFVQRNLLLGSQAERVGTRTAGDTRSLSLELGRRFDAGGVALMPYLGGSRLDIRHDGFRELGADGFGLRANAWNSHRSQAHAGLLGEHAWRWSGLDMKLDARAEWQRSLSASGDVFAASYVGLEQWLPMAGIGLAPRGRSFGLGMSVAGDGGALLRLDLSRQVTPLGSHGSAGVQFARGF